MRTCGFRFYTNTLLMAKPNIVRSYDYVNHPYDKVKDALSSNAETVFRNATRTAASRAQNVASELHVSIAGFEVGTDIALQITKVEHLEKQIHSPVMTKIELEWQASKMPQLFPLMEAELSIYPLTSTETQLDLSGQYQVPLGILGNAMNAALGHRIAEASVLRFIRDIAAYLRDTLKAN